MLHSGQNHSKEIAELVNGPSGPLVPDHEILQVIGRGAYDHVWLARHMRLGTLRTVKVVRRDEFTDEHPFRPEFEGIQKDGPLLAAIRTSSRFCMSVGLETRFTTSWNWRILCSQQPT